MQTMRTLALSAAVVGLALSASQAPAQDKSFKEMITGAWLVTGVKDVRANGEAIDSWKGQTHGQITFGRTGRFSQILLGPTVDGMKGDEPRKPDGLIVAQYGTYTVDEAGKKINFKIEGAGYSPRVKTEGSWTVEGTGDKLTLNGTPRKDSVGTFTPKLQVQRP
jgi:hypothetical protein